MPSNTPAPLAISSSARPSRDIRGQVERMNRTIKDATVRRFYYESHD
jgi:hypothetical protein